VVTTPCYPGATQTHMQIRALGLTVVLMLCVAFPSRAQERFSFFHPSTPESVERMLTLAGLNDDDVVVDLGSGDGLIPLTAARINPRVRGWGVDVNARLVAQSNEQAEREGLADRVAFYHQNAFDADLSNATVVTMWLFPELMRLLRPVILERARPGTRVVTSTWNLGSWKPDEATTDGTAVYLWIVPARVAGNWAWSLSPAGVPVRYSVVLEQHFQEVEGVARAGDRREVLTDVSLRGADLAFSLAITIDGLGLTQHDFAGKVDDDRITGSVTITAPGRTAVTLPWEARRVEQSDYFAHTGTAMFETEVAR
jgi:precorrin-6B methylase 2